MPKSPFHLIAPAAAATLLAAAGAMPVVALAQGEPAAQPAPTGPTNSGGKMYRWVDKDKTVHYSDRPQPGAESVTVPTPATYSAPRAPSAAPRSASGALGGPPAAPAQNCGITSPTPDQVFPNQQSVMISYRGPPGGTATLQLSGTLNESRSAPAGQAFTLSPVPRGTYTATVSITGEPGVPPCVTPSVTFHVHQPSLLSPVRQQMNRGAR